MSFDMKGIPFTKVVLNEKEIEAAVKVLKSGNLRQGKKCKELEDKFARKYGSKYAISVSSGTAALRTAYQALFNSGDEVIVPGFTFIATASMACMVGAKPVLCDIDKRTFTIDPQDIKGKITTKTKAIAPVHLFGNVCDIEKIQNIAQQYDLRIIWDTAQAQGSRFKGEELGKFDDAVCYSFYPTKNMFVGEGGMITTNNENIYKFCNLFRNHGQSKKYNHTLIGFNYRMTDVEAAIGIEKLNYVDQLIDKRRKNALFLNEGFKDIKAILTPYEPSYAYHSHNLYSILLDLEQLSCSRDEFADELIKEGVSVSIHYPRTLNKQPALKNVVSEDNIPNCEWVSERILSLPCHPGLSPTELEEVVEKTKKVANRFAG